MIVSNGEKQELVVANCDKQELFDWLDIIARLKDDYTQEEIGEKIGWSRSKVSQYILTFNKIDTQVLDIARKHQKGRVTKDVTHVTFNFTEGWFRTVGIEVK